MAELTSSLAWLARNVPSSVAWPGSSTSRRSLQPAMPAAKASATLTSAAPPRRTLVWCVMRVMVASSERDPKGGFDGRERRPLEERERAFARRVRDLGRRDRDAAKGLLLP